MGEDREWAPIFKAISGLFAKGYPFVIFPQQNKWAWKRHSVGIQ